MSLLLLALAGGPARADTAPALPLEVSREDWVPLYEAADPELQGQLEAALNRDAARRGLIRRKKLAVGIVDLTDPLAPRFARVNGSVMMYAASLPKIAILLAAYVAIDEGRLEETAEVREDIQAMIRTSSNPAATRMIDRIGMERIEATLRDPRFRLYDENRGGGLWVGKRYAKTGKRRPDPLAGVSHGATVTQVCRFYYLTATGRIIDRERSEEMLEALVDPRIHHKFVNTLEKRAPWARLFRKSGTWRNWHSDSVLVWGDRWRRYILVGMVESEQGEQILRDLVPVVEEVLHPGGA